MKKILSIIILFSISVLLFSCSTNDQKQTNIRITVFSGTTGFGIAKLMNDSSNDAGSNYQFTVETTDVNNVVASLINGDTDIAALPTNAASVAYNKTNGEIQLLCLNTKGVLYLLEKGEKTIDSLEDLKGKTIYTPAQNPYFVVSALLSKAEIINDVTLDSTTYSNPTDLRSAIASEMIDYAVLPEPMVTIAINSAKKTGLELSRSLDITNAWNEVYNDSSELIQGCLVVRKEFAEKEPSLLKQFLIDYEKSIDFVKSNVDEASKMIVSQNIFSQEAVAKLALPKCNIFFSKGLEMKNLISGYYNALYDINPQSIGGKIPADDFYYIEK